MPTTSPGATSAFQVTPGISSGSQRVAIRKRARVTARNKKAGAARNCPTYLLTRTVKPVTRAAYAFAVNRFLVWAREQGLSLKTTKQRDCNMLKYIHKLFFEGAGVYSARMAVFGYAHVFSINMKVVA